MRGPPVFFSVLKQTQRSLLPRDLPKANVNGKPIDFQSNENRIVKLAIVRNVFLCLSVCLTARFLTIKFNYNSETLQENSGTYLPEAIFLQFFSKFSFSKFLCSSNNVGHKNKLTRYGCLETFFFQNFNFLFPIRRINMLAI